MKIPVTFTESDCCFSPQFGSVVQIGGNGDGGNYGQGYADGKKDGYNQGFTAGETSKENEILGGEW